MVFNTQKDCSVAGRTGEIHLLLRPTFSYIYIMYMYPKQLLSSQFPKGS